MVGAAIKRLLNFNDVLGDVGWRGPQTGGRHFWIRMWTARNWLAVFVIWHGGSDPQIVGQGLLIGAMCHPNRSENGVVQQFRKRLLGDIQHELLHDCDAASG